MTNLHEVFKNTEKAIATSVTFAHANPFDVPANSPYAYHNWANGWVRFDGKKNQGSFISELQDWHSTWTFLTAIVQWEEMSKEEVEAECEYDEHSVYYKGKIPVPLTGYQGGCLLKEVPERLLPDVRISTERHGYAMYLEVDEAFFKRTDEVRLIVAKESNPSNAHGKPVIVTWFPGTLANPNDNNGGLAETFVKYIWR